MRHFARLFLLSSLLLLSLAGVSAERTTYFIPDAQGSPIAAMDEQGNLLWRESYAPYGERRVRPAANDAGNAYTGKPEDRDTGLVYMGARWYDPEAGRFTGIDPQGFKEGDPQSFGRYAYAGNSPYRYVDPNGESPVDVVFLAYDAVKFAQAVNSGDSAAIKSAGIDLAASAVGMISPVPGTGQLIKATAAAEKAAKGPVVIGETMRRVEAAAGNIPGAKILNDMPDFRATAKSREEVTSKMMQYNRKWILEQLRSGRDIVDIGKDPNRPDPSIFYQMEQNMIANYKKLHPEWNKHTRVP